MLVDEFGVELEPEMADLTRAEAEYLKIFGEHSLDRVALVDPVHPIASEYKNAAKQLRRAIKTGRAIPQVCEGIWGAMVF